MAARAINKNVQFPVVRKKILLICQSRKGQEISSDEVDCFSVRGMRGSQEAISLPCPWLCVCVNETHTSILLRGAKKENATQAAAVDLWCGQLIGGILEGHFPWLFAVGSYLPTAWHHALRGEDPGIMEGKAGGA